MQTTHGARSPARDETTTTSEILLCTTVSRSHSPIIFPSNWRFCVHLHRSRCNRPGSHFVVIIISIIIPASTSFVRRSLFIANREIVTRGSSRQLGWVMDSSFRLGAPAWVLDNPERYHIIGSSSRHSFSYFKLTCVWSADRKPMQITKHAAVQCALADWSLFGVKTTRLTLKITYCTARNLMSFRQPCCRCLKPVDSSTSWKH